MNRQYGAISGIAILLIVLNHAIHFGLQVAPVAGTTLSGLIVTQALGAFAVPAFLFVSGAFLAYAAHELSLKFLRTSLERILWPYLIWSAIFYALIFLTTAERLSPAGYVRNLMTGYPYHFVPLLVFWYLSAPLTTRVARRYAWALMGVVACVQIVCLALRAPHVFGLTGSLPSWVEWLKPPVLFRPLADWAIYFPLGLALSMHDAKARPALFRLRPYFLAATAALFLLGILNALELMAVPWARFAAPVPLMFVLPTINRASIPSVKRFEALGRKSYGIYLSHFVVINLAVFLVLRLGVTPPAVLVYPAFLALALGGSLLLMDLASKVPSARKIYRYLFGIMPPASPALARKAA